MNERIKELVEQAGLSALLGNNWLYGEELEEFAELIRADERAACANLCDELAGQVGNKNFIAVDQRQFCAKQIRKRETNK